MDEPEKDEKDEDVKEGDGTINPDLFEEVEDIDESDLDDDGEDILRPTKVKKIDGEDSDTESLDTLAEEEGEEEEGYDDVDLL